MITTKTQELRSSFEVITPAIADHIITQYNINNRYVRKWWAESMAASMKRDKFCITHQGIAFTKSGRFLDGQHRLLAIISSGIPQLMLVVTGLPEEAFSYIDIGAKRSTSDSTGLHQKTAEVCRLALRMKSGRASPMPDQVMNVAECGLEEVHTELLTYSNKHTELISTAPVRLAACVLVMDGHNSRDVFTTYTNMVQLNYAALPPVALSFMKQKEQKVMNSGVVGDVFARALKALDPDLKNMSRIQINEEGIKQAYDRVRLVINRAMATVAA